MTTSGAHTARFCYSNALQLSGVGITASSQGTTTPDDNVTHPWRTKKWQATGNSDEYVQFNLPAAKEVQQVALFNHNFTSAATVTILAATNSAFSPTAVTTSGLTFNSNVLLHAFANGQTYQYWRVRIQDSTNAANVSLGFAYMGPFKEFDYRPGMQYNVIDPSPVVRSWDNQKARYQKTKYRAVGFQIGDHLDIEDLQNIIETVGLGKDFVLMLDPQNNSFDNITDGLWRFTMYGSLVSWEQNHRMRGVFNTPVGFEEAT